MKNLYAEPPVGADISALPHSEEDGQIKNYSMSMRHQPQKEIRRCNKIAAMRTPHTAPYLAQFLNRARQKFDCLAIVVTEDRQFG